MSYPPTFSEPGFIGQASAPATLTLQTPPSIDGVFVGALNGPVVYDEGDDGSPFDVVVLRFAHPESGPLTSPTLGILRAGKRRPLFPTTAKYRYDNRVPVEA